MRRLFWKIFGWFWGAMVLIGLALYFVVLTTRADPLPGAWRDTMSTLLNSVGVSAINTLKKDGAEAVAASLDASGERADGRFWLFDAKGRELSGLHMPPGIRRSNSSIFQSPDDENRPPRPEGQGPPSGGRPPDGEPPSAERITDLAQRVLAGKGTDAMYEVAGPMVMAAQRVNGVDGRPYAIAALIARPHFGRPAAEPRTQFFGGLVVFALSGLVCYALVAYLTAPLVSLRDATQRLAEGDLKARTNADARSRRDEVADLGRDFDTMAARLEALVESQRQLLGDISHELRSPLSRLSMALALARRQAAQGKSGEEITPAFDRIGRETSRLNELIGQLLELTRLESGDADAPQTVDLAQLIAEIVADADYEAQTRERAVRVTHTQPCHLTGTASLLGSAIENVVRNAARYTAPGTAVEVSLSCNENETLITVRDHGPGVPEAALTQIFQPFYRVEAARDRESGGVGLGLAITERAIRSHGGSVSAANAPDGGLVIEIRLPAPS